MTHYDGLENFRIYNDGELDRSDAAIKQASVIGANVIDGLAAYGRQVRRNTVEILLKPIGQSIAAGMHDTFYGTDYREQLHSKWRESYNAQFAGRIGLN